MTTRCGGVLRMISYSTAARGVKGSPGDGGKRHATHAKMPWAVTMLLSRRTFRGGRAAQAAHRGSGEVSSHTVWSWHKGGRLGVFLT